MNNLNAGIKRMKITALLMIGLLAPAPAIMLSPAALAATPFAATPVCSGSGHCGLPDVNANQGTIKTILQIVFGVIGAFALRSMVLSGLKYITSAGDPGKTSEAKKGIIFALVGLMLAISAEAIVAFVVQRGAPGP